MDQDSDFLYSEKTVLELLTEMKDTSETIVDLAYAQLMFNSNSIADEVKKLEKDMEDLKYALRFKVILAQRNRDEAKSMAGILEISEAADIISDAASEMTNLLKFPQEKRPYIKKILNESDEKYVMVKIQDKSDMKSKTIGTDLAVEAQTACRIIAVKNRHGWTFDPEGFFKLRVGDEVFARGTFESLDQFSKLADGSARYEFPEPVVSEEQAEQEAKENTLSDEELTEELKGDDDS